MSTLQSIKRHVMTTVDSVIELNEVIAEMLRLGDLVYEGKDTANDRSRLQELSARYLELQPQVEA
jgi:hypothetical protein